MAELLFKGFLPMEENQKILKSFEKSHLYYLQN